MRFAEKEARWEYYRDSVLEDMQEETYKDDYGWDVSNMDDFYIDDDEYGVVSKSLYNSPMLEMYRDKLQVATEAIDSECGNIIQIGEKYCDTPAGVFSETEMEDTLVSDIVTGEKHEVEF